MSSYSLSVPFNNIALLYVYAISLRFMLFDYKLSGILWQLLISKLQELIESSTKRTTKKGELLIYLNESTPNIYWVALLEVINKLVGCPFCKGCWAGYIIYLLFIFHYQGLDIKQVIDFALFSWSCGFLSFVCSSKLGI